MLLTLVLLPSCLLTPGAHLPFILFLPPKKEARKGAEKNRSWYMHVCEMMCIPRGATASVRACVVSYRLGGPELPTPHTLRRRTAAWRGRDRPTQLSVGAAGRGQPQPGDLALLATQGLRGAWCRCSGSRGGPQTEPIFHRSSRLPSHHFWLVSSLLSRQLPQLPYWSSCFL